MSLIINNFIKSFITYFCNIYLITFSNMLKNIKTTYNKIQKILFTTKTGDYKSIYNGKHILLGTLMSLTPKHHSFLIFLIVVCNKHAIPSI